MVRFTRKVSDGGGGKGIVKLGCTHKKPWFNSSCQPKHPIKYSYLGSQILPCAHADEIYSCGKEFGQISTEDLDQTSGHSFGEGFGI